MRQNVLAVALLLALLLVPGSPARAKMFDAEQFTLANGLEVVVLPNHRAPIVTQMVWYKAGAADEPRGKTGIAHFLEHLMFRGTRETPPGAFSRIVAENGGRDNAFTTHDYTAFFQNVAADRLELVMKLEAERMSDLVISDAVVLPERKVIIEERHMRIDNNPSALLNEQVDAALYLNQRYHDPVIGWEREMRELTTADAAAFYGTWYAPNNAVLVIVGDIQTPDAKKLIEQYFGDIPSQPQPKRPDLTEPAGFQAVTKVQKDPLARVPGVVLGYQGPKRRSPDYYALNMIDAILTGGDSSRIRQDLVKGKQSVIQYEANLGWPFASTLDYRDPEPYAMFMLYNPTFTAKQIVDQVQEEIAKLQNTPVEAKELERVKTMLRSNAIQAMQGSLSRARTLAQYAVADGNPELINTELDAMLAVTPAQIQAAAKKYLTPERRAVMEIAPAPNAQPGAGGPQKEGK